MKNKCILLARVSTNCQQIESQLSELEKIAEKDGYTKDNIIKIQNHESGIQDISNINGIQQLKQYIETGNNINCVYVWEISRIARLQETIYSFIKYLQKEKIQLIILHPYIKMYTDNKELTENFSVLLTLYSQFTEIETQNFSDRSNRQKRYNSTHGKFSGGIKLFGYTTDENGYYVINNSEAEIIKKIYDLYINNDFGYTKIYNILKQQNINIPSYKIQKILVESGYTGDISLQENEKRPQLYPAIITTDEYIAAKNKRNKHTKKKENNYYYAYKLIKCTECGHYYRCFDKETYQCWYHGFRNRDYKKCSNNKTISIKLIDFLLYYTVYNTKNNFIMGDEKIFTDIQTSIEEVIFNTLQLNGRKSHIIKIIEKNKKIHDYIIWGTNPVRKIYKKLDNINNYNNYNDIQEFNNILYYNIEK